MTVGASAAEHDPEALHLTARREIKAALGLPLARSGLGAGQRRPRCRGEAVRVVHGGSFHPAPRDGPQAEPQCHRLGAGDLARGQDQVQCSLRPNQRRQIHRGPKIRQHAKPDLGHGQRGVLGEEPNVAGERQLQPRFERDPVHLATIGKGASLIHPNADCASRISATPSGAVATVSRMPPGWISRSSSPELKDGPRPVRTAARTSASAASSAPVFRSSSHMRGFWALWRSGRFKAIRAIAPDRSTRTVLTTPPRIVTDATAASGPM